MQQGFYIIESVSLTGYNGEKCDIDLTAGWPIWERTEWRNPNVERPEDKNSCKDRWIRYFNAHERLAAANWRMEPAHWIKAIFKYKYVMPTANG